MEAHSDEYLSAEELRDRLYQVVHGRGMVNSIKSQLRKSLLTELQQRGHTPVPGQSLRPDPQSSKLNHAVNSLIVHYMRRMKMDYSLSVFLPESGTSTDKVLNCREILQLLQISPQSKLFRKLESNQEAEDNEGFLWQFLCELSSLYSIPSRESCSQTDGVNLVPFSSLDDKMIGLDEYYSYRRDENYRSSAMSMEERLLSYQRQLEAESRRQMKLEMARFKENDLGRMRMEEREKCRLDLDKSRKEMEKTYQARLDGLAEKERNVLKRLEKEQEIQSRDVYTQRQTVLEEIEKVRQRESEVKREAEALERERLLQLERIQSREETARRREAEIDRLQREYDQRLENDMAQLKMEEQTKFLKRTHNLEQREIKIKEEENILKEERGNIDTLKEDLREKTSTNNRLEMLLKETKSREVAASCSNETLTARLREVSDYSLLKEENFRLKTELDTLRMQLTEMTGLLYTKTQTGNIQFGGRHPAGEINRSRETTHSPRRSQSDITMNRQVEANRELLRQFEESTLQQKEMYREMMDLRQQLHLTQQALNNEIYRKPKNVPSDAETSGPSLSADWSGLKDGEDGRIKHSVTRPGENDGVYNDVDIDGEMIAPPRRLDYREFSEDDGGHSDTQSADVVAESKYRLKRLEREVEDFEEAYRDLQYRLTNVHAVESGTSRSPAKKSLPTFTEEISKQADIRGPVWGGAPTSPIPSVRQDESLVSSTPYKQPLRHQDSNDSFSELRSSRGKTINKNKLQRSEEKLSGLQLSHLSDTGLKSDLYQGKDVSNVITLADLEARPGSPTVKVLQASDSSGSKQNIPVSSVPVIVDETADVDAGNTLDVDYHSGAKASKPEVKNTDIDNAEIEKKKAEEERLRKIALDEEEDRRWEEERKRKEEERKRQEEEEWEREQAELKKVQGKQVDEDPVDTTQGDTVGEDVDGDGIDPVMKKYMAMVQQQKQTEQQTKEIKPTEYTPPVSESEVSFGEDAEIKSEIESIPDFDW